MFKPRYKNSVLDVLVTDIGQYYMEPIIPHAVQPDNLATASPSDHRIGFAISGFASWVQHESWEFVYNGRDSSDMVSRFDFLVSLNLDHYCPTKVVRTTNLDGKISSVAVKQASRRKNREFSKNGNSAKYKCLKKEVKNKLKEASVEFLEKQVNLVSSKNNSWLKHVKRIAARPGDQTSTTFSLPKHVEDNLSALESSNKICEFFSSISQEYSPLNTETLPQRAKDKLLQLLQFIGKQFLPTFGPNLSRKNFTSL